MRAWVTWIGVPRSMALAVALVFALLGGRASFAADTLPALDANPANIDTRKFSAVEPAQVLIRLKTGDKALSKIALTTFSNDGIAATIEGGDVAAKVENLAANSEYVWTLILKPAKGGAFPPVALKLQIHAAYLDTADSPTLRHLFNTVTVNAPTDTSTQPMAGVEIKGAFDALSYERSAKAFVIVTNKYLSNLTLTSIEIHGPPFVKFDPLTKFSETFFSYGDARIFEYSVTAPDMVVPGKYPVIVSVHLRGADGVTGSVTISQDITVGVLGESDFLSKLGAPSLLFLPGVLFLLTWQLLWSVGKSATDKQAYPLKPSDTTFWLIGVVISLPAAFVYPRLTLWLLRQQRDYLVAYGLRDYIYVFGLAIAAALVLFLVWRLLALIYTLIVKVYLYFQTPNEKDQPLDILRKLSWHHTKISFSLAHRINDTTKQQLLLLHPWSQGTMVWLTPPAKLTLIAERNPDAVSAADKAVSGQIADVAELYKIVKKGVGEKWWSIAWNPVASYTGVVGVAASLWQIDEDHVRLVQ